MFREPKFREVPVLRDGSSTEFVSAAYFLRIDTGMSEVPGTLTPYTGVVLNKSRTKILHKAYGPNYSQTRGLLESWVESNAG